MASLQRPYEQGEQSRVHLSIAINFDNDIDAFRHGGFISRHDRPSHASVFGVIEHAYAWIMVVLFDEAAATLRTGVVDRINSFDFRSYIGNHAQNMLSDFVAGDHDSNTHGVDLSGCLGGDGDACEYQTASYKSSPANGFA